MSSTETLPSGGITYKKINGKEYAYYQWRENGKQRSRRAREDELDCFVQPVAGWRKRECYKQLYDYVYGDIHDRVYILYGLRRTGKTTLIRQLILDMDAEMRSKTVFIQIQDSRSLDDVNQDLKYLESNGYRYVLCVY